jgi:hypothetical protein
VVEAEATKPAVGAKQNLFPVRSSFNIKRLIIYYSWTSGENLWAFQIDCATAMYILTAPSTSIIGQSLASSPFVTIRESMPTAVGSVTTKEPLGPDFSSQLKVDFLTTKIIASSFGVFLVGSMIAFLMFSWRKLSPSQCR